MVIIIILYISIQAKCLSCQIILLLMCLFVTAYVLVSIIFTSQMIPMHMSALLPRYYPMEAKKSSIMVMNLIIVYNIFICFQDPLLSFILPLVVSFNSKKLVKWGIGFEPGHPTYSFYIVNSSQYTI